MRKTNFPDYVKEKPKYLNKTPTLPAKKQSSTNTLKPKAPTRKTNFPEYIKEKPKLKPTERVSKKGLDVKKIGKEILNKTKEGIKGSVKRQGSKITSVLHDEANHHLSSLIDKGTEHIKKHAKKHIPSEFHSHIDNAAQKGSEFIKKGAQNGVKKAKEYADNKINSL